MASKCKTCFHVIDDLGSNFSQEKEVGAPFGRIFTAVVVGFTHEMPKIFNDC